MENEIQTNEQSVSVESKVAGGKKFFFLPVSGSDEIGMNLNMYGVGETPDNASWIIVDIGVSFSKPTIPGIEITFPSLDFLNSKKAVIEAVIFTHAHEDHIGAYEYFYQNFSCPVYGSPFTLALLANKMDGNHKKKSLLKSLNAGDGIETKSFKIKALPVNHSIPDTLSLIIETQFGKVLHTGDWKIDTQPYLESPFNKEQFDFKKHEMMAIIGDSTNVHTTTPSESEVGLIETFEELFKTRNKNRIFVTGFSSNIARFAMIIDIARKNGRKVCLLGRSVQKNMFAASELGYLDFSDIMVAEKDLHQYEDNELLLICTGSQAEPRSFLSKVANGEIKGLQIKPNDVVIFSSRIIPGNDFFVGSLQNKIIDMGAELIAHPAYNVHYSGHATGNDIMELYKIIKPKLCIPVHGDRRQQVHHIHLAKQAGVEKATLPKNGYLIELYPNLGAIKPYIKSKAYHRDGDIIVIEDKSVAKERYELSQSGVIFIQLILDSKQDLKEAPVIAYKGIPKEALQQEGDTNTLHVKQVIQNAFNGINKNERKDTHYVIEAVRKQVRNFFFKTWNKKPFIEINITSL